MIEAMKQWLEALESCGEAHITDGGYQWHDAKLVDTAITSLRKAIQEEALRNVQRLGQEIEQEPIANLEIVDLGDGNKLFDTYWLSGLYLLPCGDYLLYTHPPQRTWVGLTDEEAIEIGTQCQWYDGDCERFDSIGFARAIEAKLKEKNT